MQAGDSLTIKGCWCTCCGCEINLAVRLSVLPYAISLPIKVNLS